MKYPVDLKSLKLLVMACLLLLYTTAGYAAHLDYKVDGLDGDLENNVELFLEALPEIDISDLPSFRDNIIRHVTQALNALGYYQPEIQLKLTHEHSDRPELMIKVKAGQPVVYRTVNIQLIGEALSTPAFETLLEDSEIKPGEPLDQGVYKTFKDKITGLGQSLGFFDAHFSQHRIDVYPEKHSADLTLIYESGQRYAFGDIRYGNIPEAMQQLIETMISIEPGSPYDALALGTLNKDLSATGYFNTISIEPLKNSIINNRIPIRINVSPNWDHELETGIGFSTNEGMRVSLNWDKPLINNKGDSLSNQFLASTKRAELSSDYKIPYGNPLLEFYNLQVGYRHKDLEDTRSNLITAAIQRWKKNPARWDWDLFFRVQYESYEQAEQNDESLLLIPGISVTRRKANGSIDPSKGYLLTFTLEGSEKSTGSDASFLKAQGRSKWLTTVAERHRFMTRAELGAIWINDILNIPPSIRFFTGGDQTVRGYAYESIAPKDASEKLIGGQYMGVVSFEYDYQFAEHWRMAAFIDSGTATNHLNDDSWKTGIGPGVRWLSPVGPIRLDLAFAISDKGSPWRINFSIGPDL